MAGKDGKNKSEIFNEDCKIFVFYKTLNACPQI